ncbi:MAG: flavin reductase family protein [Thermoprotei archaeon]
MPENPRKVDQSKSVNPETFRRAMSRFATGVTVVTTVHQGEKMGSTVQAFSSISLNPKLVMVSLNSEGRTKKYIEASGIFAVSVLSEKDSDVSKRFADPTLNAEQRFSGIEWFTGITGSPIISSAIAYVECSVKQRVEAGDHTIFIGEVLRAEATSESAFPLLYYMSSYWSIKR